MPEQQDLEFLRALRSAQQHDQLKGPAQSQIDKTTSPHTTSEMEEGTKPPIYELTPLPIGWVTYEEFVASWP
jgi:hypothetical protein